MTEFSKNVDDVTNYARIQVNFGPKTRVFLNQIILISTFFNGAKMVQMLFRNVLTGNE